MSSSSLQWMLVSLVVHFAVIGPLLASWVSKTPDSFPASRPVSVHFTRPPRPSRTPAKPPTTPKEPARPVSTPAASVGHRPKLPSVLPRVVSRPVAPASRPVTQTTSPTIPKIDSRDTPSAPLARSSGANGRGSRRGTENRTGDESAPESGAGTGKSGAVEIGPKIGRLPTNVPMPESLRKLSIARMELKLEISVDITGLAKVKLLESCGSSQLDRLLIDELERSPWIPASTDGRPIPKTFRLTVQGSLHPNTSTFSIVAMDSQS